MTKKALVVRGGWDGHHPVEATELFLPFLRDSGFDVRVEESNDVYADAAAMADVDLIVQSVTMSEISKEAFGGLHGGSADAYRTSSDYLQLLGGQFATHPSKEPSGLVGDETDNSLPYTVEITDLGRAHEITAGIADFALTTEQYWVLHDDLIDVLATTTHPVQPYHPWHRPIVSPAVWTRLWGDGRIFVCTPGHSLDVLQDDNVRTLIERGMLWAARA